MCLTRVLLFVYLQLLKYVPTSDEKNLLNAHNKEIEQFARADRFLYDMSRLEKRNFKVRPLSTLRCVKDGFLYSMHVFVFFTNPNKSLLSCDVICLLCHKHNWVVQGHNQKAIMPEAMSINQVMTKGVYDDFNWTMKTKRKNTEASASVWLLVAAARAVFKFHILYTFWANMRWYFLIFQNCSLRAKTEILVLQKEISWKNGRG